jgi:hypothetical protein
MIYVHTYCTANFDKLEPFSTKNIDVARRCHSKTPNYRLCGDFVNGQRQAIDTLSFCDFLWIRPVIFLLRFLIILRGKRRVDISVFLLNDVQKLLRSHLLCTPSWSSPRSADFSLFKLKLLQTSSLGSWCNYCMLIRKLRISKLYHWDLWLNN